MLRVYHTTPEQNGPVCMTFVKLTRTVLGAKMVHVLRLSVFLNHTAIRFWIGSTTTISVPSIIARRSTRTMSPLPSVTTCQTSTTKGRGILLSALPKRIKSELSACSPHYPFNYTNVKQESCEYQLFKSFGLT